MKKFFVFLLLTFILTITSCDAKSSKYCHLDQFDDNIEYIELANESKSRLYDFYADGTCIIIFEEEPDHPRTFSWYIEDDCLYLANERYVVKGEGFYFDNYIVSIYIVPNKIVYKK